MSCFHPLNAVVLGIDPQTGKKALKFFGDDVTGSIRYPGKEIIQLPCGQCIGCRIDRSRQWANRCMLELQYHDSAYFVTLTYDDFHIPKSYYPDPETGEAHTSYTLCKRDFQLWMKRLRKKFSDDKIRFFACGEYGGQTKRPHYHAIVFGLHLNDLVKYKTVKEGDSYYTYYGPDAEANELGLRIMDTIQAMLKDFTSAYSPIADHRFMLHAQVGLGGDASSPGVRIPIGREIPLYDHLRQAGLFHKYFPTGVGDIFPFETTAKQNPEAILDVFKGAFSVGMRYISTYAEDSDLIRVTGYLVKKSEVQAVAEGKQSAINDMSLIAGRTLETLHILERKVRGIDDCAGQSNH